MDEPPRGLDAFSGPAGLENHFIYGLRITGAETAILYEPGAKSRCGRTMPQPSVRKGDWNEMARYRFCRIKMFRSLSAAAVILMKTSSGPGVGEGTI